jgi:tripartite ATP-independent transporter DctM subunit
MLKAGYDKRLACGSIAAAATLAQIVPPSTVLVVLGDQLAIAYQQAQLAEGVLAPATVTVGDLFAGALFPGLLLAALYLFYQAAIALITPELSPPLSARGAYARVRSREFLIAMVAPLALIVAVLGSILGGIATPTEAAAVGAVGATLLAFLRVIAGRGVADLLPVLRSALETSVQITSMIFVILIGATLFSLVFRGLGGDETIHGFLSALPGGPFAAVAFVMAVMFVLGFFLDFLEIVFVVVPVVAPVLLRLEGIDPVWLGVLMAVNLQTSFLTPPFGPTLFYLRGVAPREIATGDIYRGAMPFVGLQILALLVLWFFPGIATWLPRLLYGP